LVSEWQDGDQRRFEDCLVAEEPLEIRVNRRPLAVTMRTPGEDLELAAGFLLTEGVVSGSAELASLRHARSSAGRPLDNVVDVRLTGAPRERPRRRFIAASGCGICGKTALDSVRRRGLRMPNPDLRVEAAALCGLPDKLRLAQTVFGHTGGLHAAALFDSTGELVVVREDVGRHNAVDKVAGWALLHGRLPLSEHVLLVSGRGGFEIIQKALATGLPVLASVSAPSGLAVRLARQLGLTLVGFLRGRRFVVYSGEERLLLGSSREPAMAVSVPD
jgi:FdhD protein